MSLLWLASYPRSGNTWLRAVLTGVCSGAGSPININQLDGPEIASSRRLIDEALGISTADLTESEIAHHRVVAYRHIARQTHGQSFIKIHDAYQHSSCHEPVIPVDVPSRIVYVVRNPLDTAVSAAHFAGCGIEAIIARMAEEGFTPNALTDRLFQQLPQRIGSWSGHVAGWLNQSSIPVLAIRYEDMLGQPEKTFSQICRFVGFPTTHLSIVLDHTRFEALRAQENIHGFSERPQYTRHFFRKGISGGWRAELSASQAHRIVEDHAPMMRRLGYLTADGEIIDNPKHPVSNIAGGITMENLITLESTIRRQRDIIAQALDDDLVMADLETGHYYGLANTAKRVWELLKDPVIVSDVCATLKREHEVDASTCAIDVLHFLNDLYREGLVLVCSA